MPLTVSQCDYLRQVIGELNADFWWEVAWCRHVAGRDYHTLFGACHVRTV